MVETSTLDKLMAGESAVIFSVEGENEFRCRLLDMGIIPKTKILLRKTAPLGDPVEILFKGYVLTIRKEDAAGIKIIKIT